MNASEIIRLPDPRENVHLDAREVVRDVAGTPTIFVRVRVTGWHFPHRAPEPFMLIGNVVSRFVIISSDGHIADAFFDTAIADAPGVSVGYGHVVEWDFNIPVHVADLRVLDRARVPPGTIDQING